MHRIASLLVFLLLTFTFNAYACLLPLQPESAMDCSSATEQPVRQTCDAFLQLGPQSPASFSQELPTHNIDSDSNTTPRRSAFAFLVSRSEHPPRGADAPIHLSISTTVLRI